MLQYYNTSLCQSKWGPLECFVEESVPALNHNESELVQCDCGVTQCLYVQLMVTIYGTLTLCTLNCSDLLWENIVASYQEKTFEIQG